jgi:hypothetical protein
MAFIYEGSGIPLLTLYKGILYGSTKREIYAPEVASNLDGSGWNDSIRSFKLSAGGVLHIYNGSNYTKETATFIGPISVDRLDRVEITDPVTKAKKFVSFNGISSYKLLTTIPSEATKIACCKGELTKDQCFQYFKDSDTGACDDIMLKYCQSAKVSAADKTGACSCILSDIKNPKCFDTLCQQNGYLTKNQKDLDCSGTYIDCRQFLTLDEGAKNNIFDHVNVQQYCSLNPDGEIKPAAAEETSNTKMYIIIVFIIIIAAVIYMTVGFGSSEYEYYDEQNYGQTLPFKTQ